MEDDDSVRGNWLREDASSSKELEPELSKILEELEASRLRSAQTKHSIFLSHSSAQRTFVRRVRKELVQNAYCPFFDEDPESLLKGESFPPQIKTACQLTYVAVLVLSDEFFTSKWPMIELSIFIREQMKREGRDCIKILPLFMGFSVKEFQSTERQEYWQKKWNEMSFGGDTIHVLNKGLKVIGKSNGLEYCKYKNEEEYIDSIMSTIFKLVTPDLKWTDSHVKGKSKFRQAVAEMFDRAPAETIAHKARTIGLYGVGGIGKTTLCKSLCNDYRHRFNGKVWHADLGKNTAEEVQKDILRHLVGISEALLMKNRKDQWQSLLSKKINHKVFLAIDNVWKEDVYRGLANTLLDMDFHPDSLVIVTSRSCEVLEWLGICKEYCFEMPVLDKKDATEVLLHSVGSGFDIESAKDYQRIAIEKVVERCFMTKGPTSSAGSEKQYVPLALDVLGKQLRLPLLRDTSMQLKKWVDNLDLKRSDQKEHPIFSVLRLSYDKLQSPKHRSIFVDVAICVPKRHDNTSASVIEVCKWLSMVYGEDFDAMLTILEELERDGLVASWHRDMTSPFGMHELYCELAKMEVTVKMEVAEADDDLAKQRYLYHEDGSDVPILMRWIPAHNLPLRRIQISRGAFRELSEDELQYMVNVEVLKLDFCIGLESLDVRFLKRLRSVELRECVSLQRVDGLGHLKYLKYFRWNTCRNPSEIADFPQALEVLQIYGSEESEVLKIGSFGGCIQLLELTLSCCPMLEAVSDLRKLHKLEKIDFSGCCKVEDVGDLGDLINLRHLILENCKGLCRCVGLEKLVKVQTLNLRGCVSLQLPTVWDLNRLVSLRSINIGSIQVVQKLVLGSPHLEQLEVKGCGDLRTVTLSNNCGSWRLLNWLNERWMGNPVEAPKWILDCQGPGESVGTGQNRTVDDHIGKFIWTIPDFTKIAVEKYYSYPFVVGGYNWRVLLFPSGNNVDQLSLYLDVADYSQLPNGWTRFAHFYLTVVNQHEPKISLRKGTQHHFSDRESDWGFTSFMPLHELDDPSKGFLVNDTLVIEADVNAPKMVDYNLYDSKKETGFVGLKNQGATAYLNILLQTLYHIPYFRKAIYHMPTAENVALYSSIPLALQSIFYKMQYSDTCVTTKDLTKSFGWDTYDLLMQDDVWELKRELLDKLEILMKGAVVEGTIQVLFEGHIMKYVECINDDYKSTQKKSFYDLELDVKGCKNIYESFDKYVYPADNHGLQDAKKRVLFIDFPPVLGLRLKRYEFDDTLDSMVKINDHYEFPLQLDLDRDNGKYLFPSADRRVRNLYSLHSVMVHDGDSTGGHYYSFIRPALTEQWYKFDDEHVTKVETKRALEVQYGGEEGLPSKNPGFNPTSFKSTKFANAYVLVYIRDSDKDKVICPVDEKDIAEHLQIRLKKEQGEKERKRKEKAEAHLYTVIKIARDEDLSNQIGKHLFLDLVDHDSVKSYRIHQEVPFKQFKEEVAKDTGIPVNCQRFWFWARRQNHTYRPYRPLTDQEEMEMVGELRRSYYRGPYSELNLWLEVNLSGQDRNLVPVPERTEEDILLFFKLYHPEKEELRFVGRLFVNAIGKPLDILEKLSEMAGFPESEEISLYEEIKFEPTVLCEQINEESTFRGSELENGDIICYQKSFTEEEAEKFRYPDVPSFLEYVCNRQIVHFRRLEKPRDDEFCIELSKLCTYDDVVDKVAQKLGFEDPSKLRLTSHNCYSQQPKPQPIQYRGVERLSDMLVHYNQTSDILYFEMLDLPLPELQGLKSLKIAYHNCATEEVSAHNIRLPKESTIGDVINDLKTKVELSSPMADLRILEIFCHKIYKVFPLNEKIENINEQYWTLRAEEVPDEEKDVAAQDRLIHVYHFLQDPIRNQTVKNFAEPFFLVLKENETLAAVKARIQNKLQVVDEDFSKYKFAIVSCGEVEYLQDDDVVANYFQKNDTWITRYGAWNYYLGLGHTGSSLTL